MVPKLLAFSCLSLTAAAAWSGTALARVELTRMEPAAIAETATQRVDVLTRDLGDTNLVLSLIKLAAKGRTIRLLVSNRETGIDKGTCERCSSLEAAGIDVRYMERPILDTFVIADGPQSKAASGDRATLGVKTMGTGAAARLLRFTAEGDYAIAYQQEFNGLWRKALEFGVKRKSPHRHLRSPGGPFVLYSSANMTPMRLPNGAWMYEPTIDNNGQPATGIFGDYIAGAIDYAYSSVNVAIIGTLERPEILRALKRALARGVTVRLLLESTVTAEIRTLAEMGATVTSLQGLGKNGGTPRLPSNAVLIDRKTLLTGNFLWSRTAEQQAFSSLLSLQGPVTTSYLLWMEYGFAKATAKMPQMASADATDL